MLLGAAASLGPGRRPRRRRPTLWAWLIGAVALLIHFALVENRLLTPAPSLEEADDNTICLVHWNTMHRELTSDHAPTAEQILAHLTDISIFSDAWVVFRRAELEEALPEGTTMRYVGPFLIITRLPLLEARPLARSREVQLVLLRFDCRETLGRELVVYAVDLASDPRLHRAQVASWIRDTLEEIDAPHPDVVIGDLNMTRNSHALHRLFPDLHHAWNDAGHGYAATFRREFPLYHIDHTLLADHLHAVRYDLIDPGVSRHYVQRTYITTE